MSARAKNAQDDEEFTFQSTGFIEKALFWMMTSFSPALGYGASLT